MMERYLVLSFGGDQPTAPEAAAETLTTIWTRVLYGVSGGSGDGG
jgi:hypothetical protein